MTDNDLVLAVLAGQTPGYRIDPAASAFVAVGLTDPDAVATLLAALQSSGHVDVSADGWEITDAGRTIAPGTPEVAPPVAPPTAQQQVLVAIDALDPATATVADVIAAVHAALASS